MATKIGGGAIPPPSRHHVVHHVYHGRAGILRVKDEKTKIPYANHTKTGFWEKCMEAQGDCGWLRDEWAFKDFKRGGLGVLLKSLKDVSDMK